MSAELIVPTLGESITEATVSKWLKKVGEPFEVDEPLVEIETDKITVEVPASSAGELSEIRAEEGTDIKIGGILGVIVNAKEAIPVSKKEEKKGEKDKPKEENTSSAKKEQKSLQNKSGSVKQRSKSIQAKASFTDAMRNEFEENEGFKKIYKLIAPKLLKEFEEQKE